MKKVIVKTKLESKAAFDRQIQQIGLEFGPAVWQHERVYTAPNFRPHNNLPRLILRTEVQATDQPAEYFLYLKRHIEDSGIDWMNFTGVTNYTEATAIVRQLGYRKLAEVSRQRQTTELDQHTRIFLDKIEGIDGYFLKIEADLDDDTPVDALRTEMYKTLISFNQETFVTQTYAELLSNEPETQDILEK